MKKKLFFALVVSGMFLAGAANAQTELKHGLLVGVGHGNVHNLKFQYDVGDKYLGTRQYNVNASLGYRLRFMPQKPFFYDLDLNLGMRSARNDYPTDASGTSYISDDDARFLLSLNASFNYKIVNGLSLGVGVEPTYYLHTLGDRKFDVPLTGKVSYDFRRFGLSFVYKHGMTDVMRRANCFKSGKMSDWQVQLFVPF